VIFAQAIDYSHYARYPEIQRRFIITNPKMTSDKLNVFNYVQDGKDHYAIGQITEIIMQNVWTQDPTMKGLIRQKGRLDPITERQDTHVAKMIVSSVFADSNNYVEQSILGTVPSTGTAIKSMNESLMDSLLINYRRVLFYLGRAYGTDIKMPMWLKHFDESDKELGGDTIHIGIFGKTGSGKSKLAIMMMLGYARNKNMSIFVLDPQNEFAKEFQKEEVQKLLKDDLSRSFEVISLHNLLLQEYNLFKKILISSGFLRSNLSIFYSDNLERAADMVERILDGRIGNDSSKIKIWKIYVELHPKR
jgi:hypothetical protein